MSYFAKAVCGIIKLSKNKSDNYPVIGFGVNSRIFSGSKIADLDLYQIKTILPLFRFR